MIFKYICSVLFLFVAVQISSAQEYVVILNKEGQHAVWSAEMSPPEGWQTTRMKGSLAKCTKSIRKVWTDMRPLSIQKEFDKGAPYMVVVNHEEQYAIWPSRSAIPEGWKKGGASGTYGACHEYIEEVWTDMRPLSLRVKMKG